MKPSFNPGCYTPAAYEFLRAGSPVDERPGLLDSGSVAGHYLAKLNSRRARELAAGNTLYGPHRDDLRLLTNGRDLRLYGSRGQQRSAALALKLAELLLMTRATGEAPLLLLDALAAAGDALSPGEVLLLPGATRVPPPPGSNGNAPCALEARPGALLVVVPCRTSSSSSSPSTGSTATSESEPQRPTSAETNRPTSPSTRWSAPSWASSPHQASIDFAERLWDG